MIKLTKLQRLNISFQINQEKQIIKMIKLLIKNKKKFYLLHDSIIMLK